MKYRKALKIFIILSLILILIYIFTGLKSKDQPDYMSELKADGEGAVHVTWNKKNQRILEIKFSESKRVSDDKIEMKDISGVIFKKGHMNKDIKVFGKNGYVSNNSHNFFIENDSSLVSDDFTIRSANFFLKDQAIMNTKKKVHYKTKNLKASAKDGMEFYLKTNVLKFFKTRGHYKRGDRDFSFKTNVLWLIDKDKMMVMEKKAVIREAGSILRSDWISVIFTDDYKHIKQSSSLIKSYFYTEDKEKKEIKEIKSEVIKNYYNDSGQLTKVHIVQNGEILLESETNHTMIAADLIEMNFDEGSGKITSISIPNSGQVENTGKTEFRISADKINGDYNEKGELSFCKSSGNCTFIIEEYRGISDILSYNVEKNSIILAGQNTKIMNRNNTFKSNKFLVDTEKKILSTSSGVKSIILLKKKNVLFSDMPIFINGKNFTIFEKENKLSYKDGVNLLQGDIELKARSLDISNDNNITSSGNVSLSFKSDNKEVSIKGGLFIFNAKEKNIEISDRAAIMNDENVLQARRFVVQFNEKNEVSHILGEEDVVFIKEEDLSGTSGEVKWLFKEDIIILKDLPQIVKKKGGTTYGEELKIDLKTNKITILSSETERTETIIKK